MASANPRLSGTPSFSFILQNSPVHPAVVSHFGFMHSSAWLTRQNLKQAVLHSCSSATLQHGAKYRGENFPGPRVASPGGHR